MEICKKCPKHTHADINGVVCESYDGYMIQKEYLFNMRKFDLNRTWGSIEAKDLRKSGSFFGPFFNNSENLNYYFSPRRALQFDVEDYE